MKRIIVALLMMLVGCCFPVSSMAEASINRNEIMIEDEIVFHFVQEINEKTAFEVTDIEKGNIRTCA